LPDLIKIDAEGAEVEALRGGAWLLKERRPSVIVEFSNEALCAKAHGLYPKYDFEFLGQRHWLMR
jgi:hypothetical protein